jgi:GTPase SAR1 family protein
MDICIIGPEASGKTILCTQLLRYTNEDLEEIHLSYVNIHAKKYFQNHLRTLRHGEWPASTPAGQSDVLKWEWELKEDQVTAHVDFIDLAGQDIREAYSDVSDNLNILDHVKNSDIIILLVDIHGHLGSNTHDALSENEFIIEKVHRELNEYQSLFVLVTKADLFAHELEEAFWQDQDDQVQQLIKKHMPDLGIDFTKYTATGQVKYFAVSAVSETEYRNEGDIHLPYPLPSLRSVGLDYFFNELRHSIIEHSTKQRPVIEDGDEEDAEPPLVIKSIPKYVWIILLVVGFIFLKSCVFFGDPCTKCGGGGELWCDTCGKDGLVDCPDCWNWLGTCKTCKGKGDMECNVCAGDGIRPCGACGGSGRIR